MPPSMAERKVILSDVSFLTPIPVNSHATYENILTMPIEKIPKSSIGISDFLFFKLLSFILIYYLTFRATTIMFPSFTGTWNFGTHETNLSFKPIIFDVNLSKLSK